MNSCQKSHRRIFAKEELQKKSCRQTSADEHLQMTNSHLQMTNSHPQTMNSHPQIMNNHLQMTNSHP